MADKGKGWISVYRSIRDHWVWKKDQVFDHAHAWIDLILDANHEDRKIVINGKLTVIHRGQKWTSVRTLADRWGWSKNKVTRFLKCLESDSMVIQKRSKNGTLLTIVNYDDFQCQRDTEGTPKGQRRDTEGTPKGQNNNNNNLNNLIKRSKTPIRSIQNFQRSNTDWDELANEIMEKQN